MARKGDGKLSADEGQADKKQTSVKLAASVMESLQDPGVIPREDMLRSTKLKGGKTDPSRRSQQSRKPGPALTKFLSRMGRRSRRMIGEIGNVAGYCDSGIQ